jgi:hypothetical protein
MPDWFLHFFFPTSFFFWTIIGSGIGGGWEALNIIRFYNMGKEYKEGTTVAYWILYLGVTALAFAGFHNVVKIFILACLGYHIEIIPFDSIKVY